MTILYRIENQEGLGVYSAMVEYQKTAWDVVVGTEIDPKMQPLPYGNKLLSFDMNENKKFFAFSSIEQLRNWFYNNYWLIKFEDLGFKLVLYETERKDCKLDPYQAVFEKEKSVKIKEFSLKLLVKNKFNLDLL